MSSPSEGRISSAARSVQLADGLVEMSDDDPEALDPDLVANLCRADRRKHLIEVEVILAGIADSDSFLGYLDAHGTGGIGQRAFETVGSRLPQPPVARSRRLSGLVHHLLENQ